MGVHIAKMRLAAAGLLLVAGVLLALSGCSDGDGQPTSTSSSTVPSGGTETTVSRTTEAPDSLMTEWEEALRDTANAQHLLSMALDEKSVPSNDPQRAILYGLKARVNALSCRNAIEKSSLAPDDTERVKQLELADVAMKEVYAALNRGRAIAADPMAKTLADAHAIVETLGVPSNRLEEAAAMLEDFIEELAPLVDEAIHEAAAPTTTLTSTTSP